jgi:hypothetical protein
VGGDFRRQRDAQIWWAAQRKAIEDGSWEVATKPNLGWPSNFLMANASVDALAVVEAPNSKTDWSQSGPVHRN